jgi:hypothetical protein
MAICDVQGNKLLVEYSVNADDWDDSDADWTPVSDVVGMLDVTGGDKTASEYKTFSSTIAAIDRPGVQNIQLTVVFQNDTDSFLETLTDTWDGTDPECLWLRWSYAEGAAGALRRTAQAALLTNPYTGGDAGSSAPVTKQLTFATTEIHRDTVPVPIP